MKKTIALFLCFAVIVSFSACGKNDKMPSPKVVPTASPSATVAPTKPPVSSTPSMPSSGNSHLSEAQDSISKIVNHTAVEPQQDSFAFPDDIDIHDESFADGQALLFPIYETMQQIPRSYGWYFTQTHNPEIEFDTSKKVVEQVRFYLKLYANVENMSREELRKMIEEYVDTICEIIPRAYPKTNIQELVLCWQIPSVSEDSLYSAMYFCENSRDAITRGSGSGLIY